MNEVRYSQPNRPAVAAGCLTLFVLGFFLLVAAFEQTLRWPVAIAIWLTAAAIAAAAVATRQPERVVLTHEGIRLEFPQEGPQGRLIPWPDITDIRIEHRELKGSPLRLATIVSHREKYLLYSAPAYEPPHQPSHQFANAEEVALAAQHFRRTGQLLKAPSSRFEFSAQDRLRNAISGLIWVMMALLLGATWYFTRDRAWVFHAFFAGVALVGIAGVLYHLPKPKKQRVLISAVACVVINAVGFGIFSLQRAGAPEPFAWFGAVFSFFGYAIGILAFQGVAVDVNVTRDDD
jgi:hypothetical protein